MTLSDGLSIAGILLTVIIAAFTAAYWVITRISELFTELRVWQTRVESQGSESKNQYSSLTGKVAEVKKEITDLANKVALHDKHIDQLFYKTGGSEQEDGTSPFRNPSSRRITLPPTHATLDPCGES